MNTVELNDRQIVDMPPELAAVPTFINAAVAADDEVVRIRLVNPQRMVVDMPMFYADVGECLAAVPGAFGECVEGVENVLVEGIDD